MYFYVPTEIYLSAGLLTEANRHARELRIKPEVKLQPVTSGDEEDIAMETMDPGEGTSAGPPVKERTKEESQEQSKAEKKKSECHLNGHYWHSYPGALSSSQVTATYVKIRYP